MTNDQDSLITLKLEDVASWGLPKQIKPSRNGVKAALPSLQRGFVWKADQIENLWDSIAQGFPIGSLLLAKNDNSKDITAQQKHSDGRLENPTHLLLDGQQRATSIALGFKNIWNENYSDDGNTQAALWVDLESGMKDDRRFIFRLVTKSHPWGYSRSNPKSKITAKNAREALECFRRLKKDKTMLPHDFGMHDVFPWDATAPVPVALLIKAIGKHKKVQGKSVSNHLLELLKDLDTWKAEGTESFNAVSDKLRNNSDHVNQLVKGLTLALDSLYIPAPVLNLTSMPYQSSTEGDDNDPMFHVFKRINTGGTTLSREDINYSMLKSAWPRAREIIEESLLKGRKISPPARLSSLLVRLYLMIEDDKKGIQQELTIYQFRKFIGDMKEKFEVFCTRDDVVKSLLEGVWEVLSMKSEENEERYRLPNVLAAGISRQGGDLMLLLMFWVYKINKAGKWGKLKEQQKKRTLGFITAISWFSKQKEMKKSVSMLIEELFKIETSDLPDFFNHERFRLLYRKENELIRQTPLPCPEELKAAIKEVIDSKDIENKNKTVWQLFGDRQNIPVEMVRIFKDFTNASNESEIADTWWAFFGNICHNKNFLLYAQRDYIQVRFGWFDSTQPDQISDHNRPWDYDHILPYSWVRHSGSGWKRQEVTEFVRACSNINGNFRAWPLELNRSKGNGSLIEKNEYEESFIKETRGWEKLRKVEEGKFMEKGKGHPQVFITASLNRTISIYEEWYNSLSIRDLMIKM